MATNAEALKGKYENVEFPVSLKLISNPNKILLDKTNFDSEFDKREWKEKPVVELESAESVSLFPEVFIKIQDLYFFLFFPREKKLVFF